MSLRDAPPAWSTTADAARPATPNDASTHHLHRPWSPGDAILPPMLPPITRVSSDTDLFEISTAARPASQGSRVPGRVNMHGDGASSYAGGAMPPHHVGQDARSVSYPSPGTVSPESYRSSRRKPPPPPINTGSVLLAPPAQPSPPRSAASFVAPTDRPPTQAVLSSSQAGSNTAAMAPDGQKGKKGLFNPFSRSSISKLLPGMKKKPRDASPSLPPPSLAPGPRTADPRIHGTRVHDFSAPRTRRMPSTQDTISQPQVPVLETTPHGPGAHGARGQDPNGTWAQWTGPPNPGTADVASTAYRPRPEGRNSLEGQMAREMPKETWNPLQVCPESPPPAPVDKDSPRHSVPPVPPKDSAPASVRTSTSTPSRAPSAVGSDPNRPASSTRTSISRNVSTSASSTRHNTALSALPRHMKSTSSRFSFDMIGAASQEKKMEERHRQRAQDKQDKQITDAGTGAHRDSRFDDFNDDFDYDAMMDDDGLDMEEEIPIVGNFDEDDMEEEIPMGGNFDEGSMEDEIPIAGNFDEDDMEGDIPLMGDFDEGVTDTTSSGHDGDPLARPGSQYILSRVSANPEQGEQGQSLSAVDLDDDQENFAGFHFQRSNPASSLASPLTPGVLSLPTPRDAEGMAIGFAMTKDTTPDVPNSHSPIFFQPLPSLLGDNVSGPAQADPALVQRQSQQEQCALPKSPPPAQAFDDDFDFDDGLADELDFPHDGTTFDESIFDNNDTDKYGRPIPGAFEKARQAMQAMHQPASQRTLDGTSPPALQSTAPATSLNANLIPSSEQDGLGLGAVETFPPPGIPGQDLAYQAALALAAQQAEASGKFRRSSSPPLPAELTVTSPTDSHASHYQDGLDASLEDDLDDYDLDDYEFDDDFIAEANASVLANDPDGFYGQEFGFYSAPASVKDYGPSPSGALSAENLSQYANGGFFCSSPARTKSGRAASRDPNLTPITERSEYSNRNSIMSLAMPPGFGGDARSPAQSPGLAQLVMSMSSEDVDPHKNLSDLLKLRSRAWGGSQASLPNSREGSPRSEHAPLANGGAGMGSSPWSPPANAASGLSGTLPNGRRGSALSIWSTSDALASIGNLPVSPMSAAATLSSTASPDGGPGLAPSPFSPPLAASPISPVPPLNCSTANPCPPVFEDDECRNNDPIRNGDDYVNSAPPLALSLPAPSKQARRPGAGHRHKGSADSISYTKEDEPESGGTIWVMERRRTSDTGEVEILEREVVDRHHI